MLFCHLFCRQAVPALQGSFGAGGKEAKLLLSHLCDFAVFSLSSLSLCFLLHVCVRRGILCSEICHARKRRSSKCISEWEG